MADTGYTNEQMARWEEAAKDYNKFQTPTAEENYVGVRMRTQVQKAGDAARMQAAIAQEKMQREAMKAAYASGAYNPQAAMMAQAEAQGDLYAQVNRMAQEDTDRSMQAYASMLQERKRMSLEAENAKKAWLLGNQQLAIRHLDAVRRAEVSQKGVQMMETQARLDATAKMTSALVAAGSSALASGMMSKTPTPVGNIASATAAPAVQQAAPSLYSKGGVFDAGIAQSPAYQGPIAADTPFMVAYK